MKRFCDVEKARDELEISGGALLQVGQTPEVFAVMEFREAFELRDFDTPYDAARYWAAFGEVGYDESKIDYS